MKDDNSVNVRKSKLVRSPLKTSVQNTGKAKSSINHIQADDVVDNFMTAALSIILLPLVNVTFSTFLPKLLGANLKYYFFFYRSILAILFLLLLNESFNMFKIHKGQNRKTGSTR